MVQEYRYVVEELTFNDYALMVAQWLETKGD